jgi:hypothetical protein
MMGVGYKQIFLLDFLQLPCITYNPINTPLLFIIPPGARKSLMKQHIFTSWVFKPVTSSLTRLLDLTKIIGEN